MGDEDKINGIKGSCVWNHMLETPSIFETQYIFPQLHLDGVQRCYHKMYSRVAR